MALNYSDLPATYKWPIQFSIAGLAKPMSFTAEFNRLEGSRIKEILAIVKSSAKVSDDEDAEEYDEVALTLEVLAGWEAKDDAGNEIPFEEAIVRKICNKIPAFPGEIMAAFITSTYKGKAKNSKAP